MHGICFLLTVHRLGGRVRVGAFSGYFGFESTQGQVLLVLPRIIGSRVLRAEICW